MIRLLFLAFLILGACGNKVEVPAKVGVGGAITVKHEFNVGANLFEQFEGLCEQELAGGSEEEIQNCVNAKVADFLAQLTQLIEIGEQNNVQ